MIRYKPPYPWNLMPEGVYAGRISMQAGAKRKGGQVTLIHEWNLHFLRAGFLMEHLPLGYHSAVLPFDFSKSPEKSGFNIMDLLELIKASVDDQRILREIGDRMVSEFRMSKGNQILGKVIGRLTGHLESKEGLVETSVDEV